MLTNQYNEKTQRRLKQSFFMTEMSLMSNSIQLPFIVHLILIIATFMLNISVFFWPDPLEPQILNQPFNNLLIPKLSGALGISENILKIVFMFNGVGVMVLYIIHVRSTLMNNFLTKLFLFLMIEHSILLVPKTHLAVVGLKENLFLPLTPTIAIDIIYALVMVALTIIVGLYLFFKVRPFRKKTIFWSLDNSRELYSYVANIARVLIIVIDGRTVSFLMISFVFELYLRLYMKPNLTKQTQRLQSFYSNLNLSVHAALLVGDFTSSPSLASQILAFFILLSFINAILSIYSTFSQERYFPLCNSQIHEYYDFYFHFNEEKIKGNNKVKLSVRKGSQSDKILSVHTLNCQAKRCRIKNAKLSQQNYCQDLQNLCSDMMLQKSEESVDNEIIYQLWRFQTGNKYKFRMQNKKISLINQYVIYCALNLSRLNQTSDAVNEQNIKSLKNNFYDKLRNCLENFSIFYEEVAKTQPKLDSLLHVGRDVEKRTIELKNMYSQLLKHSVINFKTAEVYVQFEFFFLKQSNVNQQSIDRLKKIQKSKQADHIEQIYLPTLTSYSQTGLIQNMNTECLSFFRLTRFQMKSRSIGSLLYPQIDSVDEIKDRLRSNKIKKFYTFFKRGSQVTYGSISIKQKYIENKKFDLVMIEKSPYSDFKNVILINKDTYEIDALLKQETFIGPNLNINNHLLLNWRYLYQTYLLEKVAELVDQKIVKIKIEEFQDSLFVMSIDETIHSNSYIINVKFIKNMQKKRNRVSSFMNSQPEVLNKKKNGNFYFFYDFQAKSDSLCLYGVDNDQLRYKNIQNKTKSLGKLQKELNSMLIINTLLVQNRYSKGIKSYRLYDGQLYNIDLEDKQKYVEQFQGQTFNSTQNSDSDSNQADLYLITAIFFILIVLGSLSIIYTILASASHKQVVFQYSNIFRIQLLRLQMNRLTSITRDMQENLFNKTAGVNWKDELLYSYQKLKDLRYDGLLFESSQIVVNYRNISYTGTLNEIIDVMVSRVYKMTLGIVNPEQINYFRDTYIGDVNYKIIQEIDNLVSKLNNTVQDFNDVQEILLIVGVICIFLFYALLATLMVVLNNVAKKKLNPLMMISDTEARMNQTMAEKLKYAVEMVKKNFDFDLKNILGPPQSHKHRNKPKETVIGIQKKITLIIFILVGFSLHVFLYYKFTNQVTDVLKKIRQFHFKGESLIQTYSTFAQATNRIKHFSYFDIQNIKLLRQKINYLSLNRVGFNYDGETNKFIDLVFYENSCQYLTEKDIFKDQKFPCQVCLPGYIIDNPFELGMIAYFSRAHYNILDNITDTFGSTGVFSGPFIKTFTRLTERIRSYGLQFIEKGFSKLIIYNVIYYILIFFYVALTLLVIYTLKNMNKHTTGLLKFLNYANVSKQQKKNQRKKVRDGPKKNVSIKNLAVLNSQNPSQSSQQDLSMTTSKQNIE